MHSHTRQHRQVATLHRGSTARTEVRTSGGQRATTFMCPLVKEDNT